jgi:hypothetical protein
MGDQQADDEDYDLEIAPDAGTGGRDDALMLLPVVDDDEESIFAPDSSHSSSDEEEEGEAPQADIVGYVSPLSCPLPPPDSLFSSQESHLLDILSIFYRFFLSSSLSPPSLVILLQTSRSIR